MSGCSARPHNSIIADFKNDAMQKIVFARATDFAFCKRH
jgi:hypothetical protein